MKKLVLPVVVGCLVICVLWTLFLVRSSGLVEPDAGDPRPHHFQYRISHLGNGTDLGSSGTKWQPGVTYSVDGGIPARPTVCTTIAPTTDGGDQTAQINTALQDCPDDETVLLQAGEYPISGQGIVVPGNVTLRGATDPVTGRPTSQIIKLDGVAQPYSAVCVGNRYASLKFKTPPSTDSDPAVGGNVLAADAVKETNVLTLKANPGLTAGEIVYVDEATDPAYTWWNLNRQPGGGPTNDPSRGWFANYDRPIAQVMEVATVSGTTVTFTTPFHISFLTKDNASLWELAQPATEWAGVENLYIFGGAGGDGGGGIHFFSCAYSWAKNVEVDGTSGTGVNFDDSFRCELRDSYVHNAGSLSEGPSPGGSSYLTGMSCGNADSLVENTIIWNGNKLDVMRATGGGNVYGYNYAQDAWGNTYPCEPEVGLNASHMTTPHYELFEGNKSFAFGADPVWGNSIDITVFRNYFTGLRTATPPLYAYNIEESCLLYYEDVQNRNVTVLTPYSNGYSFVGNILGYDAQAPVTQRSGNCIGGATGGFEYDYANDNKIPMYNLDPTVFPSVWRNGSCDFVTQGQVWEGDAGGDASVVPRSLYLSSAPAFFEGGTWPWVDPFHCAVATLPAEQRWLAMVEAGTYLSPRDVDGGGL
jgi:hypothetical protein